MGADHRSSTKTSSKLTKKDLSLTIVLTALSAQSSSFCTPQRHVLDMLSRCSLSDCLVGVLGVNLLAGELLEGATRTVGNLLGSVAVDVVARFLGGRGEGCRNEAVSGLEMKGRVVDKGWGAKGEERRPGGGGIRGRGKNQLTFINIVLLLTSGLLGLAAAAAATGELLQHIHGDDLTWAASKRQLERLLVVMIYSWSSISECMQSRRNADKTPRLEAGLLLYIPTYPHSKRGVQAWRKARESL